MISGKLVGRHIKNKAESIWGSVLRGLSQKEDHSLGCWVVVFSWSSWKKIVKDIPAQLEKWQIERPKPEESDG